MRVWLTDSEVESIIEGSRSLEKMDRDFARGQKINGEPWEWYAQNAKNWRNIRKKLKRLGKKK